ncbi:MFS transporter [Candidatus Sumerlaeota bacterium]|nr:MFS transporter [Candidatus Sumerlaeota bacterium]
MQGVNIIPKTRRKFGFAAFLATHFLGAFNDNLLKAIILFIAGGLTLKAKAAGEDSTIYLGATNYLFILPFLLFSGYSGYVSDVFSKRRVQVIGKFSEIVIMLLAMLFLIIGDIWPLVFVLFLMTTQSTFVSPAKYGFLPEYGRDEELSRMNGILEMVTFLAIILGIASGGLLYDYFKDERYVLGMMMIFVAAGGAMCSLKIPHVPASGSTAKPRLNPWYEVMQGGKEILKQRTLMFAVLGITFFYGIGQIYYLNLILFGPEELHVSEKVVGGLFACLALGIAAGSITGGKLSGDMIELGLVPLGAFGMSVFMFLLPIMSLGGAWPAALCVVATGFCAGLFHIPLNALLQQKAGKQSKGRVLATSAFCNSLGIVFATALYQLFTGELLQYSPVQVIQALGVLTLLCTIYAVYLVPQYLLRFIMFMLVHTIYRIRIEGRKNIPHKGPALLVCNHLSHVDPLFVGACFQRIVRFMMWRPYYELPLLHPIVKLMGAIPTSGRNRTEILDSLQQAQQRLREGEAVCIFAEGGISRSGNMMGFKRGFEKILEPLREEGLEIPVVPVQLDRVWGSVFSFKDGKFFWKWPERIPHPITVSFGPAQPMTVSAREMRNEIQELGTRAAQLRLTPRDQLHLRFIDTAKKPRHLLQRCMADSTGKGLRFIEALTAARLLAGWIRRKYPDDAAIGLLLPASTAGALANVAALMAGKIPVNLNFTAGEAAMQSAMQQCNIKTILTSKKFADKANLPELDGMVYLEDTMKALDQSARIVMLIRSLIEPAWLIRRLYGKPGSSHEALAIVIFSSGSTGEPKGVMLSHGNIISNVDAAAQVFWANSNDIFMGALPFFHSFGYTVTLWMPLICGLGVVYHPNPMDARTIGKLVREHRCTAILATPTFYNAYLRKCDEKDFASLRMAVVGAEKLKQTLADAFRDKFGVDLLEGYGATEMAPVIAVNIPDVRHGKIVQTGYKFGSVGQPLPGVSARIVDPATHQPLPYNSPGLLLVKGPNRMLGYLDNPAKTAGTLEGEWYITGDVAQMDEDGFLEITDRLSRFSKIGGEMAPHIKIEAAINEALGQDAAAVTALPDETKGEKLVVLHAVDCDPGEISEKLKAQGLPNLWIPRRENFIRVEQLPILGSGKLDLRQLKELARQRMLKGK